MPLRAVLLDVDGTLVDSNDAHARAWVEALSEHGYSVSFEEVRRRIGEGGDKLLLQTTGLQKETGPGKAISERSGEIFRTRCLPHVKPFPSVRELLLRMRDEGLQRVVATSGKRQDLEQLLEIAGGADLVTAAATAGDVQRTKPDPDLVQVALEDARCSANEVVMLGDTPYDVQAARRAGVAVIAVRCGGWSDPDLAGAVAIYDDPADLLAHYDESPLGQGSRSEPGSTQPRGSRI